MIKIEERVTKKVVGETSLFISTPYGKEYWDFFLTLPGSQYIKKDKEWEVPLPYLSKILDEFCTNTDIEIKLLPNNITDNKPEISLPINSFKTKPFDYQLDGIKYGLTHDKWLLLDMPGLGKTLQCIYIAQELKKRENIEHCLIICGINSLKENWRKEIQKHSDLSCCILGERVQKNGKLTIGSIPERINHLKRKIEEFFVITNIETLREEKIINELNSGINKFDLILFDECHRCASPQSIQGKNLLKLNNSNYKIGMTGTLLLNNPLDTYTPLKWIGVERSTYTNFKNFYGVFGGVAHNILVGFKNIDYLKDMIEKFSLRRKKDLLNLPPKTVINEYIEMSPQQEKFYEEIKNGIRDQVNKITLNTSNLLALTTRLRQATACPTLLTTSEIPSAKIDRTVELVDEIINNGEKVVVFSTFKESLYELEKRTKQYSPLICTGDQKEKEIFDNIEKFQTDPNRKLLLATWQKMGTGITLTASSYEIFLDIPWTDALYQQAQDRCYRIGTTKNVTIYHLITKNTIDERVLEIVEDKSAISNYMIDGEITNQGLKSLKKYIENL